MLSKISEPGVHAEHYEELCYRVGRAVIAAMLGRPAWFNGIIKRNESQDVCAYSDVSISKWIRDVADCENNCLQRAFPDGVDCHYPPRQITKETSE
jgi:hypothetical protein